MNDKLIIIGADATDVKKLLLKLFTAETQVESEVNSSASFICIGDKANAVEKAKALGYKTVTIAYTDDAINKTIGNSDLERGGYKFEDGV